MGWHHPVVHLPRDITLSADAKAALTQIVAIMSDQVLGGEGFGRWDVEEVMTLETRLGIAIGVDDLRMPDGDDVVVTLGIEHAALLLDGMAFTEMASVDLPWFDMVQWTADFVTTEVRQHWTDDEWHEFAVRNN
jgi:hypothetical protein